MKSMLLLAACLVPGTAALVASQEPPRPPSFAVVDVQKCFALNRNDEMKDVDLELQKIAEQIAQKLREKLKGGYMTHYHRKKAEIYGAIQGVTQILGKERGYTLVLEKNAPQPEGEELEGGRRGVLYHDPGLDITDEVLKRLNAAYAAKKGK